MGRKPKMAEQEMETMTATETTENPTTEATDTTETAKQTTAQSDDDAPALDDEIRKILRNGLSENRSHTISGAWNGRRYCEAIIIVITEKQKEKLDRLAETVLDLLAVDEIPVEAVREYLRRGFTAARVKQLGQHPQKKQGEASAQ